MSEDTPLQSPQPPNQHKRKRLLIGFFASLALVALAILIYWFVWGQYSEWTDDAYVGGNRVVVTSQISGIVTKITTDDTDFVEEGRLLIQLDPTDAIIALEKSKAELAETVRSVVKKFERVGELEAMRAARSAELLRAKQDFLHRENLIDSGSVSLEDYEHATAKLSVALADLALVEHQLQAANAEVAGTTIADHPLVEVAKDTLRTAWVTLQRCKIFAPATGIVAQRSAQVGKWVGPDDPLLAIVPLEQMWVDANYKEVQLKHLRIGQSVKATSDTYGKSVVYHGKVIGIAGGTGAVFSVLPPQNATGNWIKIVQRVPVRISLDPEELKEFPLRLGLSMEATTDTHNRTGTRVPPLKPLKAFYETDIFQMQEIGAEAVIQEIIEANRPKEGHGCPLSSS